MELSNFLDGLEIFKSRSGEFPFGGAHDVIHYSLDHKLLAANPFTVEEAQKLLDLNWIPWEYEDEDAEEEDDGDAQKLLEWVDWYCFA